MKNIRNQFGAAWKCPQKKIILNSPDSIAPKLFSWIESASLLPVSAVEWICEPHWSLEKRRIPDSMWSYIIEGTGKCWISGIPETRILPGDLIMFPKSLPHSVHPDPGIRFRMINVHFQANICGSLDLISLLGFYGKFPSLPESPFPTTSISLCREYESKLPGWRQSMTSTITNFIIYLLRNYSEKFSLSKQKQNKVLKLLPAFTMIEKEFANPSLCIPEISKSISASEVYMRKLFKETTGTNPVNFIQRRRIDHACRLLSETSISIQAVSEMSGFSDKDFFHRVFRKHTGKTPAEWRKNPIM